MTKATLIEENISLGLAFEGLVHCHPGGKQAGGHGAGEEAENPIPDP